MGTAIAFENLKCARGKALVAVPVGLDLDDERHLSLHLCEKLAKGLHAVQRTPDGEPLHVCHREVLHHATAFGEALEVVVVEHHGLAITRQLQVAFDGVAAGNGAREGGGGVLHDPARDVMQSAVRDGSRGDEGRALRHSTSTMASTSVEMPIGSDGEATAERAWRPLSPNTSTIRSDAPLMTLG